MVTHSQSTGKMNEMINIIKGEVKNVLYRIYDHISNVLKAIYDDNNIHILV